MRLTVTRASSLSERGSRHPSRYWYAQCGHVMTYWWPSAATSLPAIAAAIPHTHCAMLRPPAAPPLRPKAGRESSKEIQSRLRPEPAGQACTNMQGKSKLDTLQPTWYVQVACSGQHWYDVTKLERDAQNSPVLGRSSCHARAIGHQAT
jgi:hypothetical protein